MPRGMGRGRGAVEKPKDFGGVMKKLVKFCSRYIPVMILALVLGAAGTVCQIIGPDKLKDMTNEITKGLPAMVHGKPVMNSIDMDAVSRIAWLLVALYVGYALLSYLQSWLMANVTQRTAQQLREAISQKINRLPLKYFDKVSYGDVLSRISENLGYSREDHFRAIAKSFMVSCDNAHAVHPNHPEKTDPTNRPYLNGGVVLKYNGSQKYTTDGYSAAIVRQICNTWEIPLQTFANRSDIAGGSTLGNISTAHVSIPSADVGLAQLAMHSAFETAGVKDTEALAQLAEHLFV